MFTCPRCLAGNSHRCLRGDCAAWKRGKRSNTAKAIRLPRKAPCVPSKNVAGGRLWGSTRASKQTNHEVACLLLWGMDKAKTARLEQITYEQVRSVERQLNALNRRVSA